MLFSGDDPHVVAAIVHIDTVPAPLKVVCNITGMRVVIVSRVAERTWAACAIKDETQFGFDPGMELQLSLADLSALGAL
jgi:hypothetical protein